ncbi:MAG: ABC transporter permease [Anaerolineae bacterium]|nr:ABC transporter permease [Anaerolineae bacterium]
MIKYTIRRLIQAIPTFFGITMLSYLLMTAAPGGPTAALAFDPRISPQERRAIEARLGVSDPWPVQYLRWLTGDDWMRRDTDGDGRADTCILIACDADGDGQTEPAGTRRGILRLDFGTSFFERRPVIEVIGDRVNATFELGLSALVVSLIIGIPLGILAGVYRGSLFDNIARLVSVVFSAVPIFWLGLILLLIFGRWLDILPLGGRHGIVLTGEVPPLYTRLNYLILPTFVLAANYIAVYTRYMRASLLDVINQDYVRTAQAKGLSGARVWFVHTARNALIPIATFLGPAVTGILGGAVLTETIFSWPGLGRTGVSAVIQQDYPVVMAVVIIGAAATILGYIVSDIMYALIDPRIRFD